MKNVITDFGKYLDKNMKFGQIPDSPDNVSVLNIFGGDTPSRFIGDIAPSHKYPQFQVIIRHTDYLEAVGLAEEYLKKAYEYEYTGDVGTVYNIKQTSDILALGRDTKNRYMFSINVSLHIEK